MVTIVSLVVGVVFVLLLISNPLLDLQLSIEGMLAVNVAAGLLGLLFGAMALALGALTGRRGLAIGLSAGIAVAAFFLYGLAPLVDALEPLGKLSPFYWYLEPNPLANGFDPMLLWMVAFTGLFVGVCGVGFCSPRRRGLSCSSTGSICRSQSAGGGSVRRSRMWSGPRLRSAPLLTSTSCLVERQRLIATSKLVSPQRRYFQSGPTKRMSAPFTGVDATSVQSVPCWRT